MIKLETFIIIVLLIFILSFAAVCLEDKGDKGGFVDREETFFQEIQKHLVFIMKVFLLPFLLFFIWFGIEKIQK